MRWPGFINGTYTSQSLLADAELTMNWYPERIESPYGKNQMALYPTPGFQLFAPFSQPGTRALQTMNGRTFAVIAHTVQEVLYSPSTGGSLSGSYGTVTNDRNPAQIAMNGLQANQAFIGSGSNGYTLNLGTNALTQVLTNKTLQVGMLDGYFVSFDNNTGRIWLSNLNDGLTWDPTQFAQRTSAPDTWRAMIIVPPDIWLIGSYSGDIWYDAGTFPFPFAPRQGINFKWGIIAPFSLASAGATILWLSQSAEGSGIVLRTQGYTPSRCSTSAIETRLAQYARDGTIADAEAFCYQDQGHTFYVLRFPTARATEVYDLDLDQWHRRGYWDAATNQYDVWLPRAHTFNFGKHLIGNAVSGDIAAMDITYGTELDGQAIRRQRRTPGLFSQQREVPMRVLEVYLETGVATQTGQGADPVVLWRTSDDGGRTWGHERQTRAGRVGEYARRVRIWRMGTPRDRVNEMTVTDPIPWRIVDAFVNHDAAGEQG